jgi:competence ComEA-like helix-hairpin-helix protein
MPTTGERHALLFLAAVALIGAGARTFSTQQLARQVDAGERVTEGSASRETRKRPDDIGARALESQIAAVDSARAARANRPAKRSRAKAANADAPRSDASATPIRNPKAPLVVDINHASAAELERLPRVGPALALRIIAWREAHGPFRSVEDLRHVRGIGPATAALLAPSVTF